MRTSRRTLFLCAGGIVIVGVVGGQFLIHMFRYHAPARPTHALIGSAAFEVDRMSKISPDVREIVGLDARTEFRERRETVGRLSEEMSQADITALCEFLKTPREGRLSLQQNYLLRNAVMDVLCAIKAPSTSAAETLISVYNNENQGTVLRDYALQHLALMYDRGIDRNNVLDRLWAATSETSTTLAGTAVTGLYELSTVHAEISSDKLSQTVIALADSDEAGPLARISAIQVCARMHLDQILPATRTLAAKCDHTVLRIAAVAALGDLGGKDDLGLLEQLTLDQNPRVQLAAKDAVARARQRIGII